MVGGWQDVWTVDFAAADIRLIITIAAMIGIAICIMTTATCCVRRFSHQDFQSMGMNDGWGHHHEDQHCYGNIPYGHTKPSHGYMNTMNALIYLDLHQEKEVCATR